MPNCNIIAMLEDRVFITETCHTQAYVDLAGDRQKFRKNQIPSLEKCKIEDYILSLDMNFKFL